MSHGPAGPSIGVCGDGAKWGAGSDLTKDFWGEYST